MNFKKLATGAIILGAGAIVLEDNIRAYKRRKVALQHPEYPKFLRDYFIDKSEGVL